MSTLRAAVAAAALAAVAAAAEAQTSVTLYGIADGGFSHVIGQDAAKNRIVSGVMEGSRWGLRGRTGPGRPAAGLAPMYRPPPPSSSGALRGCCAAGTGRRPGRLGQASPSNTSRPVRRRCSRRAKRSVMPAM